MKKNLLLSVITLLQLFVFNSPVLAQKPYNMADAKKQMARAQFMIDSIKKSNPAIQQGLGAFKKGKTNYGQKLDSINMSQPGQADRVGMKRIPDEIAMPKMPDFDKLNKTLEQSQQNIQKMQAGFTASNNKGLPQKSSSGFTARPTNEQDITAWASDMYDKAKIKAGNFLLPTLNKAYYDTSQNPASIGMIMLAAGLPKCTAQYLVCKYLLDHPKNAMAINDLGIFMRIEKDYTKAISLFLYAENLNDTSAEIKTNLGWAYSYAGDFSKAKNYFNKVLKIYPDYGSALEGLSLMAYKEGDLQTVWKNLAKQLLNNSKTGGLGIGAPSGQMASFCGGVMTEEEMNKMTDKGNSDNNTAFDNPSKADEKNQSDEKNIDTDDDIDYPSYAADFPEDLSKVSFKHCFAAITEYGKAIERDREYLKTLLLKLPHPMQFINSDGDLETIYNYENDAHYLFFYKMHQKYEKRAVLLYSTSEDKITRAIKTLGSTFNGVFQAFQIALAECDKNNKCSSAEECPCRHGVRCDFLPRLASTLKNFGMSIGQIITSTKDQIENLNGWYIDAGSPMLQYISEPNWNKYLNALREADIRKIKLTLMRRYQQVISITEGYVGMAKTLEPKEGDCIFEARIPQQSIKSKYRNLKTLAPPCKDFSNKNLDGTGGSVDLKVIKYEDNCNHTKLSIKFLSFGGSVGAGGVKAGAEGDVGYFWETVKSKFVGEDISRNGIELHTVVTAGISTSATDGYGVATLTTSAGLKSEIETTVDFFRAWGPDGKEIKRGVMFDASATISGKAGATEGLSNEYLGIDKAKMSMLSQGFEKGAKASGEYAAVLGPDGQVGNYEFSNLRAQKK